ncbi:MAG: hypothetical protein RLZ98_71 [Pseudomonadota bacterium]|jgi:hypothetical protein
MQGRIVKFREDLEIGVIHTDTGEAFRFASREVVNAKGKLIGSDVDFLLSERRPREIYLMQGTPWEAFASSQAN